MSRSLRLSLVTAAPVSLIALVVGCSTQDEFVTAKGAALHQAVDCDDLLEQIQADAIAKLDQQVEFYREHLGDYRGGGWDGGVDVGGDGGEFLDGGDPTTGAPEAPTDDGGTSGNGSSGGDKDSPDSHSETNTQVEGVDEADIVKTDGERIYLLHGDRFFLVDAWPADETRVLGSVQVEGSGYEMFVEEGKAVLFSLVYPNDVPGGKAPNEVKPAYDCYDCWGGPNFTKISVFDVTGNVPELEREMLFEGYYVSGRRHGDVVRTIVQGGFKAPNLYSPNIDYYDSFGNPLSDERIEEELDRWRADTTEDIRGTDLEDWIPRRFERNGDAWAALPTECGSFYTPEPGRVQEGVTQVVTFDVKKSDDPHVVAVLGGAETVYANEEVLVLGQTDWTYDLFSIDSTRTSLHQFAIDGSKTKYQASGFVPGYLHNQFSIDEKDGVIRVSTTENVRTDPENDPWITETKNRVFALSRGDSSEIEVLSRSEAFGETGETIFATRFIGDRAYVVTFRQTDPLVVVDLSNPKKLTVLGELHIPGFSDYIHPLAGNHLLTIGQDADENGSQTGVALQIFDVSDATNPVQAHKTTFGGFSYSEASSNHKAFTFVKDYFGDDESLLLFPITTYDPTYRSTLEVVKVSSANGFEKLGSIDHATLLMNNCPAGYEYDGYCYYGGQDMRRGVQIDEFIYAISYGGITVQPIASLDTPAATIELPTPTYDYYYGGEGGGISEPSPIDEGLDGSSDGGDAPAVGGSSGK